MIRQGVKNYFLQLKHIFTLWGALAFGLVLGLSLLLPRMTRDIQIMTEEVNALAGTQVMEPSDWMVGLADVLTAPEGDAKDRTLLPDIDRMNQILNGTVQDRLPGNSNVREDITACVARGVDHLWMDFILFLLPVAAGLGIGYFAVKVLVRRRMAPRTFKKFLLASLVGAVSSGILALLHVLLGVLWLPGTFLAAILTVPLTALATLLCAYWVHGNRQVAWRSIVNIKNVGYLLITNLSVFLSAVALSFLFFVVSHPWIGTFVAIPLLVIAAITGSMNAEAYVKERALAGERGAGQADPRVSEGKSLADSVSVNQETVENPSDPERFHRLLPADEEPADPWEESVPEK